MGRGECALEGLIAETGERCSGAGIGGTDAHHLRERRRNAVGGDRRIDGFGHHFVSHEDKGEGEVGVAHHDVFLSFFIDEMPSRCHLHEDVTRTLGIIAVADAADTGSPCSE